MKNGEYPWTYPAQTLFSESGRCGFPMAVRFWCIPKIYKNPGSSASIVSTWQAQKQNCCMSQETGFRDWHSRRTEKLSSTLLGYPKIIRCQTGWCDLTWTHAAKLS